MHTNTSMTDWQGSSHGPQIKQKRQGATIIFQRNNFILRQMKKKVHGFFWGGGADGNIYKTH